jgi:hypothetical protein
MRPANKLEAARNLVRIYREVLELPVPAELEALVRRLEIEQ